MSLHPQPIDPIPEETARVARAAFPKGNPYMRMRDELGVFYQDEAFRTKRLPPCSPRVASRRNLPGVWLWSWCCSRPRASRISRRPRPSGAASTGSMRSPRS